MILLHCFDQATDLTQFTKTLWQQKIPHRVRFFQNEQQVWLQDASQFEQAKALMKALFDPNEDQAEQGYKANPDQSSHSSHAFKAQAPRLLTGATNALLRGFTKAPITLSVMGIVLLVAGVTALGSNLTAVAGLSFFEVVINSEAYLLGGFDHLFTQPWRLLTPMLLHFSWLHLVFNGLWWLDLGKRIEGQSKTLLLILLVSTSIGANLAQALQGTSLFGGMSGVIYGLIGYIWLMDRFNPPKYAVPQSIIVFLLVWLLLGLTGVFGFVGFGAMANMAHMGGLLTGLLAAIVHTFGLKLWPTRR